MMDLNAIESFLLAAETLNFTEVAQRRNTVQSAVSAHIAKLEVELGRTLISRGRGQQMQLTAEGQVFAAYARRLLSLADEASETIRTAQSRRILRLGTTVTLAMSFVSDVLAEFAAEQPDVQIHIHCDRSDALLARLEADEIDVAFMMDQGKRQDRQFVHSLPLVWVSAAGFDLPVQSDIPLAFLTDGRDLRSYAFKALDKVGRQGRIAHLSPHPVGVRAFVQSGLALTVMPLGTARPPLQTASADLKLPKLSPVALAAYLKDSKAINDAAPLLQMLESTIARQSTTA